MRKTAEDYSGFPWSGIREPKYRHLLLLLSWPVYFTMYFLTENLIPPERCTSVHIWLDDWIPFCEWFVIPYVFWYFLIVISIGFFLRYNAKGFRRLQVFLIITQAVAMAIYILFPNRQDLRPEVFPRNNALTWCVGVLYRLDTNTGVCPSLHVAYSIGMASAWMKEKKVSKLWKSFVAVTVILICLSTMFIKQHSAADFFAALPVCLLAEGIAYGGYWLGRRKR